MGLPVKKRKMIMGESFAIANVTRQNQISALPMRCISVERPQWCFVPLMRKRGKAIVPMAVPADKWWLRIKGKFDMLEQCYEVRATLVM
jgi:hypothetical protein